MKVPYSMDDDEPDLYGSLGGHQPDDQDLHSSCGDPVQRKLPLVSTPMFVFYSVEELVTSEEFQRQLGMALKSKQKQIDELRVEILELANK